MKDLPEINLTCKISKMSEKHMDKCVDLFIDVFSRPPWNDTFDSREQVSDFSAVTCKTTTLSDSSWKIRRISWP